MRQADFLHSPLARFAPLASVYNRTTVLKNDQPRPGTHAAAKQLSQAAALSPDAVLSGPDDMDAKPPRRTRERILELSLKLFNEIGEPNVTTTTIAEEMEISPGNLYYHFRNKDDIINSIFSQFEQEIDKRLRFPDDHRATIDEMWAYLQYMVDFTWRYRFLYRDLNDLLARNRTLEMHFKQIISHKVAFAKQFCDQLKEDGEMVATPEEIAVISTNIGVIATYWLSYQFVMNPRKYNDQEAIRVELHQVSVQIVSLMAPYLRGRAKQLFDDLVSGKHPQREFYDYLPPRDGAPKDSKESKEARE
jgi:AcrR family transcriptional regulator